MVTKLTPRKLAKRKQEAIFASIRKPSAPPGHPMSHAKPDEKARPAGRKAKHKRKPTQVAEIEEVE